MKTLYATLTVLAVVGLSACSPEPKPLDPEMKYCLDNGGTYKYHGNSGSYDCFMPDTKANIKDHTS